MIFNSPSFGGAAMDACDVLLSSFAASLCACLTIGAAALVAFVSPGPAVAGGDTSAISTGSGGAGGGWVAGAAMCCLPATSASAFGTVFQLVPISKPATKRTIPTNKKP